MLIAICSKYVFLMRVERGLKDVIRFGFNKTPFMSIIVVSFPIGPKICLAVDCGPVRIPGVNSTYMQWSFKVQSESDWLLP